MKIDLHSDEERGFNADKFRRHYVSGVDNDPDPTEEPEKSNLGRVFTFLLLLHIFLIGAVIFYNLLADKPSSAHTGQSQASANAKTSKAQDAAVAAPAIPSVQPETPTPTEVREPAPENEETVEVVVGSGQNIKNIATINQVSDQDIMRLNGMDSNTKLVVGSKILIPKRKPAPAVSAPVVPDVNAVVGDVPPVKLDGKATKAEDPSMPAYLKSATQTAAAQYSNKTSEPAQTTAAQEGATPAKPTTDTKTAPTEVKPRPTLTKTPEAEPRKATESKPKEVAKTQEPKRTPEVKKTTTIKPQEAKPVAAKRPESVTRGGSARSHTVKARETYYGIAQKYGVSVEELKQANSAKSNNLQIGAKLRIPAKKL